MRRLDPTKITGEFNAYKDRFNAEHDKTGMKLALVGLSSAIGDLKSAGMDVSLDIFGCPSEQAFDLFPGEGQLIVPVSGILKIGTDHRLVAIATTRNAQPVLELGMSEFDIRFNGPDATVKTTNIEGKLRGVIYDLKADPDALVKFQREVLRHCARNTVVNEQDVAGAFESNNTLRKPGLKAPPKPQ